MKSGFFIYSAFIFLSHFSFGQLLKDTVKDIDGNIYHQVSIGNQIWMVENLKVDHYNNGDKIETTSSVVFDITNEESPRYQWVSGGVDSNLAIYGRLYTLYTVHDTRGLCPQGWHVPTIKEWGTLVSYLNGPSVAGGLLKDTSYWHNPNVGATNESGFSARPSGLRKGDGTFQNIGISCNMLSSSWSEQGYPWSVIIINNSTWIISCNSHDLT